MNISLLLNTFKYLKFEQIYFRLFYRLRRSIKMDPDVNRIEWKGEYPKDYLWQDNPMPSAENLVRASIVDDKIIFNILNRQKEFPLQGVNWNYLEYGKLWNYNLAYFEYLSNLSADDGLSLIYGFIDSLEQNAAKAALEPYPVSLRIIFWIKFLIRSESTDKRIQESIFKQSMWLTKNLERHLLANHYLENGIALSFAGIYLNNHTIFKVGTRIIDQQINEQILIDGAHYERSVMYHKIILYRLLDLYNLSSSNRDFANYQLFRNKLELCLRRMLSFLAQITTKSDHFPKFNDATIGIAPGASALFSYAGKLNIQPDTGRELSDSGFRHWSTSTFSMFLNIGEVAPSYQPGHAHADTFSFELYVDNEPYIVDTGISTYEKNKRRLIERSTESHNTVTVGSLNSSEVWGGFRVGKRARVKVIEESHNRIIASHDGYGNCIHEREFQKGHNNILIKDRITGKSSKVIGMLHFHPNREPVLRENNILIDDRIRVEIKGAKSLFLDSFEYAHTYNRLETSRKLIIHFSDTQEVDIKIIDKKFE